MIARVAWLLLAMAAAVHATPRARDLGVPFEGEPGPFNAITDVPGVEVGHVTLVSGAGPTVRGKGPVRSGVTMILPRGHNDIEPVNAGFFNLNGNGEMTGQSYIADLGLAFGPIGLTDTNGVGQVYAGIGEWTADKFGTAQTPVVAETWSGYLSDVEGLHVTAAHARQAIELARAGPVEEGNVGGGTGMVCFGFKGGMGSASRKVSVSGRDYTIGVLVQCNMGARRVLRIAGVPVGHVLENRYLNCYAATLAPVGRTPVCGADPSRPTPLPDKGSIIIVIATDAPIQGRQIDRLARHAALGLGRLGAYAGNGSGDLVVAFSTARPVNNIDTTHMLTVESYPNGLLDPLFEATAQGVEEAVVNALVSARDMTGADGRRFYALPPKELRAILQRYGRLADPSSTRQ